MTPKFGDILAGSSFFLRSSVFGLISSIILGRAALRAQTLDDVRRQRERLQAEGKPLGPVVLDRDARTGMTLKLGATGPVVRGPSWEDPDVPDEALPDGELATKAIAALRAVGAKPFFLAIGFAKPHLPFVAPRKYYDLYHQADPQENLNLAGRASSRGVAEQLSAQLKAGWRAARVIH